MLDSQVKTAIKRYLHVERQGRSPDRDHQMRYVVKTMNPKQRRQFREELGIIKREERAERRHV